MATSIDLKTLRDMRALVVDDQGEMRGTLRDLLYSIGIAKVMQASSGEEAVRLISAEPFGVVLCDINLGRGTDGHQVLEYVRANDLVDPRAVWLMVTGENDRKTVLTTGDNEPDGYLIKPFSAGVLEARLATAFARKERFAAANARLAAKDHNGAIRELGVLVEGGGTFAVEALRRLSQCHFELGQIEQAQAACEQALAINDNINWAQLGVARCRMATGDLDGAQLVANRLKERSADYAAVYDFLVDLNLQRGDANNAMDIAQQAARRVPSASRIRQVAHLAEQKGDLDTAVKCLERVLSTTKYSLTRQSADLGNLATVLTDAGQPKAALDTLGANAHHFGKDDRSLHAASLAVKVRANLQLGNEQEAKVAMQALSDVMQAGGGPSDARTQLKVAKAAFAAGETELASSLVSQVARGNHETTDVLEMARKVLRDSGREGDAAVLIDAAVQSVTATIARARALVLDDNFADAVALLDTITEQLPGNVSVLLSAAQTYVLSIARLGRDPVREGRTVKLLARLQELAPGSDRVVKLQARFRESLLAAARR